jgi:hypothetical protein
VRFEVVTDSICGQVAREEYDASLLEELICHARLVLFE